MMVSCIVLHLYLCSSLSYIDSCVTMNDIEFDVVIGRGSFGDVYKGLWKGTTVALKRIRFPPECTEQSVLYANEIAVLK